MKGLRFWHIQFLNLYPHIDVAISWYQHFVLTEIQAICHALPFLVQVGSLKFESS